jgi:hypothetical protein
MAGASSELEWTEGYPIDGAAFTEVRYRRA